jgi:hypothetical protein
VWTVLVRAVYSTIWAVWSFFEKYYKESSDLMARFPSIPAEPPPIYSAQQSRVRELLLDHHFGPSSIFFHSISINPSRRPPFPRGFERSKTRSTQEETMTEQETGTWQHSEFESSLFVVSLLFLITFVTMPFVLVFLYAAMSC